MKNKFLLLTLFAFSFFITVKAQTSNNCNLINSVTLKATQTQSQKQGIGADYLGTTTANPILINDSSIWHYVAMTKSNLNGALYVDGVLVNSSTFSSVPYIWNSFILAATQSCVSCSPIPNYNGLIDEVRISNIARTSTDISNAYASNLPFIVDANTIGLFHCDSINGNSFYNSIPSSNATLYGSPQYTNGKFNKCIVFNGLTDYSKWVQSIPTSAVTIEFWYKSISTYASLAMFEYAYNTRILLLPKTVNDTMKWSNGMIGDSITVNPTQLSYLWVTNGKCKDTVFFNSSVAIKHIQDTITTHISDTITITKYDTITTHVFDTLTITKYDTIATHISDTITTHLAVTDTLIINAVLTGISAPNNINTIKVFPNPAKDHLTINYGNYNSMNGYSIKIMNALAQTVYSSVINQQQISIDLSTFTGKGIYTLSIFDFNSHLVETEKIILQ